MLVYRIELKVLPINHGDNIPSMGPYCSHLDKEQFGFKNYDNSDYNDIELNPTPEDEGLPIRSTLYYGFRSIQQMINWFNLHLKVLHEGGCHLVIYDVPTMQVFEGRKQLSFVLSDAKVISFQSLMPIYHKYKKELELIC